MIKQNVQVELGTMICNFGSGDIAVGLSKIESSDKPMVGITLSNIKESQEIGSKVENKNICSTPVVMMFDNIDSLCFVKSVIEKAIDALKEKEKENVETDPEFMVKCNKLIVPELFKRKNPSALKVMDCMKNYNEKGEIDRDIVVNSGLVIEDGYIGYVVAVYNNVDKIKVIAKDGIRVCLGDKYIDFKSNKIVVLLRDCKLILENCGNKYEFEAPTVADAVGIIRGIESVFEGHYLFHDLDSANTCLYNDLKFKTEMNVEIVESNNK